MFGDFDINFVIFGVMPYVALTVFLVGSIARYERDPFTWKSSSSQLLRRKQLIWGSILFHVGILTVFFGHLIGLFTPIWVLDAIGIPYALKQWMAVLASCVAAARCSKSAVQGGSGASHCTRHKQLLPRPLCAPVAAVGCKPSMRAGLQHD